jgi:hypothetical protein
VVGKAVAKVTERKESTDVGDGIIDASEAMSKDVGGKWGRVQYVDVRRRSCSACYWQVAGGMAREGWL